MNTANKLIPTTGSESSNASGSVGSMEMSIDAIQAEMNALVANVEEKNKAAAARRAKFEKLTASWVKRADAQGWKNKSKKYLDMQHEFWTGAASVDDEFAVCVVLYTTHGRDTALSFPEHVKYL